MDPYLFLVNTNGADRLGLCGSVIPLLAKTSLGIMFFFLSNSLNWVSILIIGQGCRNGETCYFSHASVASFEKPSLCRPEDRRENSEQLLRFFPKSAAECILLLDDSNLHFSSYESHLDNTFKIVTPMTLADATLPSRLFEHVKIVWSCGNSGQSIILNSENDTIVWDRVRSVLWFPTFNRFGDNKDDQKDLVKNFFQDMALRILQDSLFDIRIVITMNNIRFSQLQVSLLPIFSKYSKQLHLILHETHLYIGS